MASLVLAYCFTVDHVYKSWFLLCCDWCYCFFLFGNYCYVFFPSYCVFPCWDIYGDCVCGEYPVSVPSSIIFHCGANLWRGSFVFCAGDFLATYLRVLIKFVVLPPNVKRISHGYILLGGLVSFGVLERWKFSDLSISGWLYHWLMGALRGCLNFLVFLLVVFFVADVQFILWVFVPPPYFLHF